MTGTVNLKCVINLRYLISCTGE